MDGITQEQSDRMRLGEMAENFLKSSEWNELLCPIIDSFEKGIADIRSLKSAELGSETKAKVEVMARKMTLEYILGIKTMLEGYVTDKNTILSIIEKKSGRKDLYKQNS